MLVPLYVLSVGALLAGVLFASHFIGEGQGEFWKGSLLNGPNNHILDEMEHVPFVVSVLPTLLLLCGFLVAGYGYLVNPAALGFCERVIWPIYTFVEHKWYFDELYDFVFVRPAFAIGRLFWRGGDEGVIDRFGPDGLSARVVDVTRQTVKLQTGYVYNYAFAMLIGVTVLITWFLVAGVR